MLWNIKLLAPASSSIKSWAICCFHTDIWSSRAFTTVIIEIWGWVSFFMFLLIPFLKIIQAAYLWLEAHFSVSMLWTIFDLRSLSNYLYEGNMKCKVHVSHNNTFVPANDDERTSTTDTPLHQFTISRSEYGDPRDLTEQTGPVVAHETTVGGPRCGCSRSQPQSPYFEWEHSQKKPAHWLSHLQKWSAGSFS